MGKTGRAGRQPGRGPICASAEKRQRSLPSCPSFPSFPPLLILFLITGCAGPRQNVDSEPLEASGFSLVLNNHHLLDVNIFLQHDGQADRIATVISSSSRSLVLPLRMLGHSRAIRLIAEPIGDETQYTSDLLVIQPGQIIELNVEGTITRSNYSIQ
jgi:hypothetical protein